MDKQVRYVSHGDDCLTLRSLLACLVSNIGHHGKGTVLYSWHPSSQYLATVGTITSLINGTNNITAANTTPIVNTSNLQQQTRCIWIWNMKPQTQANASTSPSTTPTTAASSAATTPTKSPPPSTSNSSSSFPFKLPSSASNSSFPSGPEKMFQILTPNPAPCIGLEWDSTGTTLAILQAAPSHEVNRTMTTHNHGLIRTHFLLFGWDRSHPSRRHERM